MAEDVGATWAVVHVGRGVDGGKSKGEPREAARGIGEFLFFCGFLVGRLVEQPWETEDKSWALLGGSKRYRENRFSFWMLLNGGSPRNERKTFSFDPCS